MSASYLPSFICINICALAFIPAFYTLSMMDDPSLNLNFSLLKLVASLFLKLACISIYYHTVYYTALLIKPNLKCFRVLLIFLVVLVMVICSNLLLQIVGHVIMKFNFVLCLL